MSFPYDNTWYVIDVVGCCLLTVIYGNVVMQRNAIIGAVITGAG